MEPYRNKEWKNRKQGCEALKHKCNAYAMVGYRGCEKCSENTQEDQVKTIAVAYALWLDKRRKSHIKFRLLVPTVELYNEFIKEYDYK